jgi:peptidoglycan/LPS O-acetylase OafA/YrhL
VAVLLVVIYHANVGIFDQGFLGVDVFFVLSGFLITKLLIESLDANSLSISNFYLRRAMRLLPALYSTLLITTLLALTLLTPSQLSEYAVQLIGALTFSSNLVLPTQIGYFAADAESMALLHIWSLSLEEQYYFLLPALLILTPKKWRFAGLMLAFSCSLWMCLDWVSRAGAPPFLWRFGDARVNEWAFFLFPTRAWELLAGSLCAHLTVSGRVKEIPAWLKWSSLLSILFVGIVQLDQIHPRSSAIIAVLATSLLVLGRDAWLPHNLLTNAIAKVGDWSYSIYLVHWPIFVFFRIVYLEVLPIMIGIVLISASVLIGGLQFKYVETPLRYGLPNAVSYAWTRVAIFSILMVVLSVSLFASTRFLDLSVDPIALKRQTNYGLSEACEGSIGPLGVEEECVLGSVPTIAIWGDSYAMHLVPGLAVKNSNLVQLTKSVCGPIVGVAPIYGNYNLDWAKSCSEHNTYAFELLAQTESIRQVVLSSTFSQYFSENSERNFLTDEGIVSGDPMVAIMGLRATIQALVAAGKSVLVVSPPPRTGLDIGSCLERADRRLLSMRACEIHYADYLEHEAAVNAALRTAVNKTAAQVLWLADLLCDQVRCFTRLGGMYIYRDAGHLSIEGSIAVLGKLDISNLLNSQE